MRAKITATGFKKIKRCINCSEPYENQYEHTKACEAFQALLQKQRKPQVKRKNGEDEILGI